MTTNSYRHKRGDTFSLAGTGNLPFANATASAQLREPVSDALIDSLNVTLTPNGQSSVTPEGITVYPYLLALTRAAPDTARWQLGSLLMDVEFRDSGTVRSSGTVELIIERDITHG